jgi:hypothetical protein
MACVLKGFVHCAFWLAFIFAPLIVDASPRFCAFAC